MKWYIVQILFLCLFLCAGCGVQDKALVLPIATEEQEEVVANEAADEPMSDVAAVETERGDVSAEDETTQSICVYVCGAVQCPGVVKIPEGSRVADALAAAGGFTEEARAEVLNLAAKVSDGQMLRFPAVTETVEDATAIGPLVEDGAEQSANSKININTADAEQLITLSGIGESRAKDIITYRESHGGFRRIEDIMNVSGIKESIFDRIKERITVE